MKITIDTPALLFPAISLILLAYTNRFMSLAKLVRDLHAKWLTTHSDDIIHQIRNLRLRLRLIRDMQGLGIAAILGCVISMFLLFQEMMMPAMYVFGTSLVVLIISMSLSLWEIIISTGALEHEIKDMEVDMSRKNRKQKSEANTQHTTAATHQPQ